MAERSEAVEEHAVRDGSATYSVEAGITTSEDVPPGYKRTEVGLIPKDWQLFALGEILTNVRNGAVYTPDRRDGLPITRIETISNGIIDWAKVGLAKPDIHLKGYLIETGDILYSHINSVDHIGKVAVFSGDGPLYHGMNLLLLRPEKYVYPYWLFFHLASEPARKWARATAKQAVSQASINTKELRKYIIALPSQEEQRAIATALSDADALIESLDRLIAKKRAIKQAAMQQLLSGQTRLPGFTGEWETKRLGDVAELHRRGITPGAFPDAMFQHFSLPAFDETQTPTLDLGTTIGSSKFRVPEKAVLVSKLNPRIPRIWKPESIGANAVASTEFLLFTPREGVSRDFLYVLCCSPKFVEQMELLVTGTTGSHQRISPANALKIEIMLPPSSDEQTPIATVLSNMDTEIEALEHRRDKAHQIKQGMMQHLLTGGTRLV